MLDHNGRRRLLYAAVTVLEPYASAVLVQHYVAYRNGLILPLLRIYVDLERLTRARHLVRHVRRRLGGKGMTFFWETPGLVLVEQEPLSPRMLMAMAPLTTRAEEQRDTQVDRPSDKAAVPTLFVHQNISVRTTHPL